jgi:vacuolar-type H+-ATPase subunit D/Vma8
LKNPPKKSPIKRWISELRLALLRFKRDRAIKEQENIEKTIKEAQENLNAALAKAQESGERIAVLKSAGEIHEEMGKPTVT